MNKEQRKFKKVIKSRKRHAGKVEFEKNRIAHSNKKHKN